MNTLYVEHNYSIKSYLKGKFDALNTSTVTYVYKEIYFQNTKLLEARNVNNKHSIRYLPIYNIFATNKIKHRFDLPKPIPFDSGNLTTTILNTPCYTYVKEHITNYQNHQMTTL